MAKAKKSRKVDPFKTRKTRTVENDPGDTLTPPEEIAEAVDRFRECQEQAKHFEGEATLYKDQILNYSRDQYAQRLLQGKGKSFKVVGDETVVTFVVMDSSAGLTEEDVSALAERWGEKAAEELVVRDFASIRFDPAVLEAHYDQVVEALQTLPEEVLGKLFRPMLMKARPGAADLAKKYAKEPEELRELLEQLKLKQYIR